MSIEDVVNFLNKSQSNKKKKDKMRKTIAKMFSSEHMKEVPHSNSWRMPDHSAIQKEISIDGRKLTIIKLKNFDVYFIKYGEKSFSFDDKKELGI